MSYFYLIIMEKELSSNDKFVEEHNWYREKRYMNVLNSIERQGARSVPVCIAPFKTNVVKRGRDVKPSENRSRTGLT